MLKIKEPSTLLIAFLFCVFLLFMFVFYWTHQAEEGRQSPLVGARVCGELTTEEAQDQCCVTVFAETPHVECKGSWQFDSAEKTCSFVCDHEEIFCTAEAQLCPDNVTYVGRNASLNCAFNACP